MRLKDAMIGVIGTVANFEMKMKDNNTRWIPYQKLIMHDYPFDDSVQRYNFHHTFLARLDDPKLPIPIYKISQAFTAVKVSYLDGYIATEIANPIANLVIERPEWWKAVLARENPGR